QLTQKRQTLHVTQHQHGSVRDGQFVERSRQGHPLTIKLSRDVTLFLRRRSTIVGGPPSAVSNSVKSLTVMAGRNPGHWPEGLFRSHTAWFARFLGRAENTGLRNSQWGRGCWEPDGRPQESGGAFGDRVHELADACNRTSAE